jgi:16S rRNA (uracil1498-N3)-methyltransferase
MSAGRFFVPPAILVNPEAVTLPDAIAHQARDVLRLNAGDTITLLDGSGLAATVELREVTRGAVTGRVVADTPVLTEPRARLTLCVGLLKAAKFEWVAQKATELGIHALIPMQCRRAVVEDASPAKLARWRTIATEAAEQSERGVVPEIYSPMPFAEALRLCDGMPRAIALAPHEDRRHPSIAAVVAGQKLASLAIAIGPEGGFDPAEEKQARDAGWHPVALGSRVLRAETAAITATALALAALGEMG